jgi:hypothetical protein
MMMTLSKLQYFDDEVLYFFQNYDKGNVLPGESLFHEQTGFLFLPARLLPAINPKPPARI